MTQEPKVLHLEAVKKLADRTWQFHGQDAAVAVEQAFNFGRQSGFQEAMDKVKGIAL